MHCGEQYSRNHPWWGHWDRANPPPSTGTNRQRHANSADGHPARRRGHPGEPTELLQTLTWREKTFQCILVSGPCGLYQVLMALIALTSFTWDLCLQPGALFKLCPGLSAPV